MNKCLTILLNVVIWDQHATPGGIFSLFICIAGGIVYQQSPMRGEAKQVEISPGADDDAFKADMSITGSDDGGEEVNLIEKGGSAAKRRG
jgi:hypothetical protein